MSNSVDPTVLYIKERITFMPWGILPLVLFILGHGPGSYNFIILYNLLWGVFFFRVFDDYFCFDYDLSFKKSPYLLKGKQYIVKLMCVFGFLYLSSQIMIHSMNDTILVFAVIFLSLLLYIFLKVKKWIVLVSLLKYPLLLFITANYSGETNFVWIYLGSFFFIGREIVEEFFGKRNKQFEVIFILLIISTKLILRFI
jgi:hypothetical protein